MNSMFTRHSETLDASELTKKEKIWFYLIQSQIQIKYALRMEK